MSAATFNLQISNLPFLSHMKYSVFFLSLLITAFITISCDDQLDTLTDQEAVLTELLDDFLAGASVNDYDMHNLFWSEDLIYTGSTGRRVAKADIMESLENADPNEEPEYNYHAEDVQINQYGEMAVVAFRLVSVPVNDPDSREEFFNTGTFQLQDGQWRAVAWQATRIP